MRGGSVDFAVCAGGAGRGRGGEAAVDLRVATNTRDPFMRFLRGRRTRPQGERGAAAGRPTRATRGGPGLEILESRLLLSFLDIANGTLNYSESYGGTTNQLSIVSTGAAG